MAFSVTVHRRYRHRSTAAGWHRTRRSRPSPRILWDSAAGPHARMIRDAGPSASERRKGRSMQQLTEIRWHARAGQGAVTAAKLVAETALEADQYMQAMPEYGPERMGAPIKAFTRICRTTRSRSTATSRTPTSSSSSTRRCSPIVDVARGPHRRTASSSSTRAARPTSCARELGIRAPARVASVDASGISLDTLKRDIPNTPMIGALAKVTGLFELEQVVEHLRQDLRQEVRSGRSSTRTSRRSTVRTRR